MKGLLTILLALSIGSGAWAQNPDPRQNQEAMEKIQAARIGYITERLNLTPEQAQRFWPIYNEFSNKRRELRTPLNDARRGLDPKNLTEEQSQRIMEISLEIRQAEINLEKDYAQRLRDVVTAQQILALRRAEDEFGKKLRQMIQDRQRLQQDRLRNQQRQQDQRQRGNN